MNKIEIAPQSIQDAADRISAIEAYLSEDSALEDAFQQSDGETVAAVKTTYRQLSETKKDLLQLVTKTKLILTQIGVQFKTVDKNFAASYFNEIGSRK
jgi:hypothetical protein